MAQRRGLGAKLLSHAYREYLAQLVPEEERDTLKLPEGSTWADAVAVQTLKRSVGIANAEAICFQAITELRESTEGKTPERAVVGGNVELAALVQALAGPPAIPQGYSDAPVDSSIEGEGSNGLVSSE